MVLKKLSIKPYSDFICIFGKKNLGKTTYARFLMRNLERYVILDHKWEHGGEGYVTNDPQRIFMTFQKFRHLIYQPLDHGIESSTQFFRQALLSANYTLVIEEADYYAYPRGWICDEVRELVLRGKQQGIGLIVTSRRPASLHNDIRANADYVICFHIHHVKDRKYVAEWIGCTEEEIKGLNASMFESLLYNDNTGEVWRQGACEI